MTFPTALLTAIALIAALAGCGGDRPDLDSNLRAAAAANDVERARELIADGADVNAKDPRRSARWSPPART